jgi:hypothetical protein
LTIIAYIIMTGCEHDSDKRLLEVFLSNNNLRKVMAHLCNSYCGHSVSDPIADTVVMMLTCPVNLIITEVGIALFQNRPTALYPFSKMDACQRYYVEEVVRSCLLKCNSIPPCAGDQVGRGQHSFHNAMVQMGGGCILYTRTVKGRPSLLLNPLEVLQCACDCIFDSKDHCSPEIRHAICSIVLQRVCSMSNIKHSDQQAADDYISGLLEKSKASSPI